MFFIFSKLLAFVLSPLNWAIGVCLLSVMVRPKALRQSLQYTGLAILLLFGNPFFARQVVRLYETPLVKESQPPLECHTVVVLGGFAVWNEKDARAHFTQSSDRLWQALTMLPSETIHTLVLSGGTADIYQQKPKESVIVAEFLQKLHLPDVGKIWVEDQSRNTYENATFCAKILNPEKTACKIILVTSAYHMPRAKACFEAMGFDVFPYSTDPLTPASKPRWHEELLPSLQSFRAWEILFKEWTGLLAYHLKGYI